MRESKLVSEQRRKRRKLCIQTEILLKRSVSEYGSLMGIEKLLKYVPERVLEEYIKAQPDSEEYLSKFF